MLNAAERIKKENQVGITIAFEPLNFQLEILLAFFLLDRQTDDTHSY